jgi:hypothetical protein
MNTGLVMESKRSSQFHQSGPRPTHTHRGNEPQPTRSPSPKILHRANLQSQPAISPPLTQRPRAPKQPVLSATIRVNPRLELDVHAPHYSPPRLGNVRQILISGIGQVRELQERTHLRRVPFQGSSDRTPIFQEHRSQHIESRQVQRGMSPAYRCSSEDFRGCASIRMHDVGIAGAVREERARRAPVDAVAMRRAQAASIISATQPGCGIGSPSALRPRRWKSIAPCIRSRV